MLCWNFKLTYQVFHLLKYVVFISLPGFKTKSNQIAKNNLVWFGIFKSYSKKWNFLKSFKIVWFENSSKTAETIPFRNKALLDLIPPFAPQLRGINSYKSMKFSSRQSPALISSLSILKIYEWMPPNSQFCFISLFRPRLVPIFKNIFSLNFIFNNIFHKIRNFYLFFNYILRQLLLKSTNNWLLSKPYRSSISI